MDGPETLGFGETTGVDGVAFGDGGGMHDLASDCSFCIGVSIFDDTLAALWTQVSPAEELAEEEPKLDLD